MSFCARLTALTAFGAPNAGASGITGELVVQRRQDKANGVFVGTANSAGTYANRAFHLAVFC